jgi:predicted GNAT superfamily acetyltransferase
MEIQLIDAEPSHYDALLQMNADAVPNVNLISRQQLAQLHRDAVRFRVAEMASGLCGFVLALSESADYTSMNFRWFQQRYPAFVYIDRVVVHASQRSAGIGHALYSDVESHARKRAPILACEVNLRPPNPRSLAFHERFGFREVGQQDTEEGAKRVCLMAKELVR